VAKVALAAGYWMGEKKKKGLDILKKMWSLSYDCNAALHSISKKLVAAGRIEQAKDLLQGMIESGHIHPETQALLAQCETQGIDG
jgi:pentatricopeptide repeat protein